MYSRNCIRCNGTEFYADRALAGRLICRKCGMAVGTRNNNSLSRNYSRSFSISNPTTIIVLALLVMILVLYVN